jgi:hypothetical protein
VGFVTQIVSIAGPAAFDMRGTRDGDTITFRPAMNVTRPLTLNPADGDDTVDFTGSTDNLIVSVSIQGSSGDDVVTSLPSIPVFVDFSFGGGSDPNVATVSRSGDDLIVEQTASDVRSLRANGVQTVSLSGGAGPNEISFGDVGDAGIGAINYIGGVDDDLITWTMQQTPGDLDAFIEVTADTLRIDVQGQPFMQEIIGNGGTISGQGFGDLQYGRFENLEFLNLPKSDLWLAKE